MDNKRFRRYVALFLVGIIIAVFPYLGRGIHSIWTEYKMRHLYDGLTPAQISMHRSMAQSYNASLGQGKPEGYGEILNFSDGIMGFVRIPKIRVDLPIYHGTEADILAKGAGHLPESAFPVGGGGNHAVITAHTGYPGASMFSDLVQLRLGDTFEIHILKEVLCYRVDQILTVLPDETAPIAPVDGKDYCTLVTCTPYGINSHRLLVRGIRQQQKEGSSR